MALTKDWLLQEAGSKVYFRGVSIHSSQPLKVQKTGNHYEAYIWGTEKYYVTMDADGWPPACSCTCPYDFGYICKHIVALGLAILDGNFREPAAGFTEIEEAEVEDDLDAAFYRNTFLKASQEEQNAFLKQLFTKHPNIRAQFRRFVQSDQQAVDTVDVVNIRDSVHGKLDSLDIDIPYDFYDDEGDGIRDLGLSTIESVLRPYFANAASKFAKGDLKSGVAILAGIYEGCHNLEEPFLEEIGVEWEVISDFESDVLEVFTEQLETVSQTLKQVIAENTKIVEAIDQLFARIHFYNEDQKSKSHPMVYNLEDWNSLLNQFLEFEETAAYFLNHLEKEDLLDEPSTGALVLKIAEKIDNEALWLKSAEANAGYDPKIALQLLAFYDEKKDTASFYRVAQNVYAEHPPALSGYLADTISPQENRTFFVQVLSFHSLNYRSIKHYKMVRHHMTNHEKQMFLNQARADWNKAFYLQVLEVEEDYATLLELAKQNINELAFIIFLRPLISADSDACWKMTAERIKSLLRTGTRGREWYRSFAEELNLISSINLQYAQKVKALVSVLLSEFPRLIAMKDEFRKARLI